MAGDTVSVESVLARGRAAAAARMTDTCRITKPAPADADPVWNPTTGQYDTPGPVTVYEGRCRIPSRRGSASVVESGPEAWQVGEFPLDLPFTAAAGETGDPTAVEPGMAVKYLTAPYNPTLVGREYVMGSPIDRSSQSTVLRWKIRANV